MSAEAWDADLDDFYADQHTADAFEAHMADRPPDDKFTAQRPAPVDQFEADVAYAVRRLEISDTARQRYNASRADQSMPAVEDVAAVVRGEVAPLLATMLTRTDGTSLIYPGLLHWLYGPAGLGKSWIAVTACAQLLNAGGTVGYFDWEGNRMIVGERLRAVGVDPETVEKRFHYYRPGNLEPHTRWLAETAEPWHLCIFDGTARALAASGRDEERNPDVLAWMELVLAPITAAGCAVLMLDHVTKDPENRTMARGAGAKMGEVSGAAWELKAGQPFNRRRAGFVKLIQRKDREGRTGIDGEVVAEVHITPRQRGDRIDASVRPPQATATDQARLVFMERLSQAVEALNVANGKRPSTNGVHGVVGGDKARVSELLNELADSGHVRKHKDKNSWVWEHVAPYLAPAVDPAPSPLNLPDREWIV